MNWTLLQLDGPYRDWTRRTRRRKRITVFIYLVLVVIMAILIVYNVRLAHSRSVAGGWGNSWMPKEECERTMLYHGPFHKWRMTSETLEFYRGGEWIVAKRRNQ